MSSGPQARPAVATLATPVVLTLRTPTVSAYVRLAEALGHAGEYAARAAEQHTDSEYRAGWLDVMHTLRTGATEALAPPQPDAARFAAVRAALDNVLPATVDDRAGLLDRLARAATTAAGPHHE